jgi:hypothetical protein
MSINLEAAVGTFLGTNSLVFKSKAYPTINVGLLPVPRTPS